MEAYKLLKLLGIRKVTKRHLQIINDFIDNGETDAKKLLNQLGNWEESDLEITEKWIKEL